MPKESGIQCLRCKDRIFSEHRHDFKRCGCGKVAIDGGREYTRVIGDRKNWKFVVRESCAYTEVDGINLFGVRNFNNVEEMCEQLYMDRLGRGINTEFKKGRGNANNSKDVD